MKQLMIATVLVWLMLLNGCGGGSGTNPGAGLADSDGDGIVDSVEGVSLDSDGDGLLNYLDTDSDNDGIGDQVETLQDSDLDGIANYLDSDSDNDGVSDAVEGASDFDGDGLANYLDLDSDDDGVSDQQERIDGSNPLDASDFNVPVPGTPSFTWASFTPASGARIMYVSSTSGDDNSGQFYLAGDAEIGADPFNPVGPVNAFATVDVALSLARDGQADWILLKRGDTFTRSNTIRIKSGISPSAMSLLGAYGSATQRPLLIPQNPNFAIVEASTNLSYAAVVDLDMYEPSRDPGNGPITTYSNGSGGILLLAGAGNTIRDILIENVRVRYLNGSFNFQNFGGNFLNLSLRGNVILHSYADSGRVSGVYLEGIDGLLMEGNVLDHNGWLQQSYTANDPTATGAQMEAAGQATIFNHNAYLFNVHNAVVRNNAVLRASSLGLDFRSDNPTDASNILVHDNLFVEGEVGLSISGQGSSLRKFNGATVTDNVFLHIGRSRPTDRYLSWAINLDGLYGTGNLVSRNLFALQEESSLAGNSFAIKSIVNNENLTISDNLVYNYNTASAFYLDTLAAQSAVTIQNNQIQTPAYASSLVQLFPGAYSFISNRYFSAHSGNQWFLDDLTNPIDNSGWAAYSGESGADFSQVTGFPDPAVRLESYIASLTLGTTYQDFLNAIRAQSRDSWNPSLEPAAINDYFRAGFGI